MSGRGWIGTFFNFDVHNEMIRNAWRVFFCMRTLVPKYCNEQSNVKSGC